MTRSSVIIIVADGARPDTLAEWIDAGQLPALAGLRAVGGRHTITTCFPSVTGPAYLPFLCGRHPAPIGLPGLRWLDRSRCVARGWGHARSYVGHEMRKVDTDLDPAVPTAFELVPGSLGALSVIRRGLGRRDRLGTDFRSAFRTARIHFTGDVGGWLDTDRKIADSVARRVREGRPRFVFAALTGVDKTSHQRGHRDPLVLDALRIIDGLVARLLADADAKGRAEGLLLLVVSDHGHSPVSAHEDLAGLVASWGHRVIAHPWMLRTRPTVGVMVSGNAMAHLYLEPARRERPGWIDLEPRWRALLDRLLARPSVDLALLPVEPGRTIVAARARGRAVVIEHHGRYGYEPVDGDPLGLGGPVRDADEDDAWARTRDGDYPDALVQIARIAGAPRSGDVILSAARGWDFRATYEPIPHVSSHGALHREHMLVPLLGNRSLSRVPRRTVDVFATAMTVLGVPLPEGVEGISALEASATPAAAAAAASDGRHHARAPELRRRSAATYYQER